MYVNEPKHADFPKWMEGPAFSQQRRLLYAIFETEFEHYVAKAIAFYRKLSKTCVVRISAERRVEDLRDALQYVFTGNFVGVEKGIGHMLRGWPSEFSECITVLSISGMDVAITPDTQTPKVTTRGGASKRKQSRRKDYVIQDPEHKKYGSLRLGHDHLDPRERLPALGTDRPNSRASNKFWRCVSDQLHREKTILTVFLI